MADDSFLKQCGGFNPAPDFLIQKYGFEAAHVWGAVWRYCQMSEQDRPRSHEAMAKRAGMSRRTFIDYLNLLIKDGYIEDLDPGVRNRPHLYDTKKGEELIKVGMQISHTENPTQEDRCAEFAQDNDVGMRNLHTGCAESTQPGMQNLHLIDSSKIQVKDTKRERESHTREEINKQILAVCGYDLKYLSAATGKKVNDTASQLIAWGATVDLIKEFSSYWWGSSPPTLKQLVDDWSKFMTQRQNPKKEQNGAKQNGQYKSTKQQQIIPPPQAEQERLLRMAAALAGNDPA